MRLPLQVHLRRLLAWRRPRQRSRPHAPARSVVLNVGAFGGFRCRLMAAVVAFPATASAGPSPIGAWQTASGHGVVAIEQCGGALCGRIVGIDREPGEPMPTDVQGRSQCGLTIITNALPGDDGAWFGDITDPRNGNVYRAKLWVDERGDLHLRGYVGIPLFGQTQVWRRYTGRLTAECGFH